MKEADGRQGTPHLGWFPSRPGTVQVRGQRRDRRKGQWQKTMNLGVAERAHHFYCHFRQPGQHYDPAIPYDNNASQRAIRKIKVKLKVSGQFKSGQEHYCILRSIIDTNIKNGQSVFEAIAALALISSPTKAAVYTSRQ